MRTVKLTVVLRVLPLLLLPLLLATACSSGRSAPSRAAGAAAVAAPAGGAVRFEGRNVPLERVQAQARATRRPALLWLVTSWCGYCRRLEQETMSDPRVAAHVAGYLNHGYDCDTGVGRQVADRHGVRGFPTLLRIDAAGNVTGRYEGFDPPEAFLRRIPPP